ncbi:hypothetical protein ENKOMA206B_04250 [Enterobacter kobei]
MIDFAVRFAAMISFISFITGASHRYPLLVGMEFAMLAIWLIQDFRYIKRIFYK